MIGDENLQAIWPYILGNDLAETMFEQVRTLVAGDDDRPDRAGLSAGWREREGWVGLIEAHVLGLANFLALCNRENSKRSVLALSLRAQFLRG